MTDTQPEQCPACGEIVPDSAITESDAEYEYAVCPACSTNLRRATEDAPQPWEAADTDEGGRPHNF